MKNYRQKNNRRRYKNTAIWHKMPTAVFYHNALTSLALNKGHGLLQQERFLLSLGHVFHREGVALPLGLATQHHKANAALVGVAHLLFHFNNLKIYLARQAGLSQLRQHQQAIQLVLTAEVGNKDVSDRVSLAWEEVKASHDVIDSVGAE